MVRLPLQGRQRWVSKVLISSVMVLAAAPAAADAAEDPFDVAVRHAQAFAVGRLNATTGRIPTTAWPFTTSGLLWTTSGAGNWTSGFLPGTLWNAYEATADGALRTKAQNWQAGLAGQAANTSTHDVGFIVFDSFGNGYRLTGTDAYRQTVLQAAGSLATRYSSTVGSIRSMNSVATEFQVIIDNMMNLELLFWAAKHGGQQLWFDEAVSHALKTAQNHVRPDGSTYQMVVYDPATGAVKARRTVQGVSADSTWARGQAWAVHGFTMAYRETRDVRFLDTARRVADWYLDHLPADKIPYWDFNAPGIPNEPRDTSAAAIAASGLVELSQLETDAVRSARYLASARSILTALLGPPWLSEGSGSEAVLLHGTYNKPGGSADTGLIWGDYYLQEALMRLRTVPPTDPALPVAAVTASSNDGNVPANAIDGNLATRWSASGDGQWLSLDLGAPRLVTKVTVAYYLGDTRAARFDLQTSTDGTTWTTRTSAVTSATTVRPETYDIPDTTARYVRLLGHAATGTTFNSVTEISARGDATTTPPPPPPPPPPPAGIVFHGAATAANPTATTLTIAAPSAAIAGDVEVMAIAARGTPTITPPAGWSQVRLDANSTTMRQVVFTHVAAASEPASYTWKLSSSQAAAGVVIAYGGVSTVTPVNVAGGQINASNASVTAPSVTTTKAGAQLVGFFGTGAATTFTPPSAMTERGDVASSAGTFKVTVEGADVSQAAAGATGTRAAKAVGSAANVGQLVALAP